MAINKTFAVNLDMKQEVANDPIMVVEGDSGNVFVITLTDDGNPVDLTGCLVVAVFSKPTKQTVEQDSDGNGVTIGGANHNVITIAVRSTSFAHGTTNCEIQVYSGENHDVLVTSAKFNFPCRPAIMNGDTLPSTPEYPILAAQIARVSALETTIPAAIAEAGRRIQSDWSQTDDTKTDYLKNKPTIPSTPADIGAAAATHASRHAAGGADAVTPAAIGAAVKATATATLTVSGWSSNVQTVNVPGVTSSDAVIVSPANASRTAYGECGVSCSAQGDGTLTFSCEEVPEAELTVNILILT